MSGQRAFFENFQRVTETLVASDPATAAARAEGLRALEGWEGDVAPRVLPPPWIELVRGEDGAAYRNSFTSVQVVVSAARERDGKRWLHVSVSRPRHLPTWDELKSVKELFVGKDRYAVQVLPPEAEYVNLHPRCLHIFACLDEWPLPDFTRGGKSL